MFDSKLKVLCINSANMSYDIQRPLGRLCWLYSCVSRLEKILKAMSVCTVHVSVVSCAALPWLSFRESVMHRDADGQEVGLD